MVLTKMASGLIATTAFAQIELGIPQPGLVDKIDASDRALTCIVNLDGHAIDYDPNRWAFAPFVTDLSVFVDTTSNPEGVYNIIESRAKRTNPELMIGRYLSGARAQSTFKQFPPEAVDVNDLPPGALRAGTDRVNLDDSEVAREYSVLLVNRFREHPRPILFVDNIVHPSALSGWYSWEKSCRLLRAVRAEIHKQDAILIANVAVASWAMSDDELDNLAASVDGVSFEIPFHPLARQSSKSAVRQIEVYRRLLDRKKIVILIPVPNSNLKTNAEKANEARLIAGLSMMVRRPGDRIYVAWPYFRNRDDWDAWPAVFGAPKGDVQIKGLILQRDFMNVGLTLDLPLHRVSTSR